MLQKAGQYPLRHPPDDCVVQSVRSEFPALAADVESDHVAGAGIEQEVERNPVRGRHLGVQAQRRSGAEREDEGPDGDGREQRRSRHHIVEAPDQVPGLERDTDFFGRLAYGRAHQIRLVRILAPAREGHVAGPRISRPLGATDEQDRVGVGSEDDGDGSPDERIAPLVHQALVGGAAIETSATTCIDTDNTVWTAGETIALQSTPSSTPTARTVTWSVTVG